MEKNEQTNINDFLGELFEQQKTKGATSVITKGTRMLSHQKTEKKSMRNEVLDTLGSRELTAREIAVEMNRKGLIPYPARAVVQPRITELVEDGIISAVGVKHDDETDRNVAVYKVV